MQSFLKTYIELYSVIGDRYWDEKYKDFFCLPKIYDYRFVWMIARGKPGTYRWKELCGEISLSLLKEEISFGTLSQNKLSIIMLNAKKTVTVEIVSLNGSHFLINGCSDEDYFYKWRISII